MEKSGITRRIDDLGRIVIPKEIRRNLKIKDSEEVEISVIDNKIVLSKYESVKKDKTIGCLLRSIGKFLGCNVFFTSRDRIIDYYSLNKENIVNYELDESIIQLLENRKIVCNNEEIYLLKDKKILSYIINPIIINGDLIGGIILSFDSEYEVKCKQIVEFVNKFLELYLE